MRAVTIPLWVVVLLAAGCVTYRDQVGVVRGMKFAAQVGGELGGAIAGELAQVGVDIGAIKVGPNGAILPAAVDPAAVVVSAPAANENAKGIADDRATRQWWTDTFLAVWKFAETQWPWLTALGALGAGAAGLWQKLRTAGAALKQTKATVTASVTLFQRAKDALADGRLTLDEFKGLFYQANEAGEQFVDGAAGLKQEYDRLKTEWTADGTPIRER